MMFSALMLVSSSAAITPTTPVEIVKLTEPYVECRRDADQKIVLLQQKIQDSQRKNVNYDVYSDPTYRELNDAVLKAEEHCNLPRYISLVKNAFSMSVSYNDFQKEKLAGFLIQDVIKLQWTFLSAQLGTYKFPEITVTDRLQPKDK